MRCSETRASNPRYVAVNGGSIQYSRSCDVGQAAALRGADAT